MKKIILVLAAATLFTDSIAIAEPGKIVEPDDGTIDGHRLEPYSFSWKQCSLQDGEFVPAANLHEELAIEGNDTILVRQSSSLENDMESQSKLTLQRTSLAPIRLTMSVTRNDVSLQQQEFEFGASGYTGIKVQGDETTELSGIANTSMLHGMALGLPLAAMGKQDSPVGFKASMVTFDGTYDVTATWVGIETLLHQGSQIESQMVDVEWKHIESGDIYSPGPDGSGGRYWIVHEPPKDFPYVPRYKTDSYAIEYVPEYCE